jgi:hypothetical protein
MLKQIFPAAGAVILLILGILAANNAGTAEGAALQARRFAATPTPTVSPVASPSPKDDPEKPEPSPTMQP